MTSPTKPWEANSLQNSAQVHKSIPTIREPPINARSAPLLPPLPRGPALASPGYGGAGYSGYNMPYSSMSSGYGGYGGYGMPYRSSLYNSYSGGYNSYNSYGMYGTSGMSGYPGTYSDDSERRFIQYAEESSRNTFASVENIVRAVNSISMMLDNTFFAMTSSFRAVLSVADNFGRLRSMFGQVWYSINIFRLFNWLYRKLLSLFGFKSVNRKSAASLAWKQASSSGAPGGGSSWPTLAFLGVLVSAPYIISKFLPKYEDKSDPSAWKSSGVRAKAAFDFMGRSQTELSVQVNDEIVLAPTYVQDEMHLRNSGWAFGVCNGRSGVVPLNYLVIHKGSDKGGGGNNNNLTSEVSMPIPRKHHTQKRVSFGENQIFENVDLEDYVTGKKEIKSSLKHKIESVVATNEDDKGSLKSEDVASTSTEK